MSQPARYLDPRHLVVLTRERLTEVVEDAVRRGRMTRQDAADLVGALLARGRPAATPPLPIEAYDELTAAAVQARLGDLTPAELLAIRDHERRHGNRKSVLLAIERRLR